jgi:hypothetical protein
MTVLRANIRLLKVWMRILNAGCATRNFAFHMVVGRTSSITWNRKYKLTVQNKASNNSISNSSSTKNISEMEKRLSVAAQEATFSYHNAVHNHNFKSIDCITTVMRKLFNDKCACSQIKCIAIIINIIAPFAIKHILQELKEYRFSSV